MNKKALLFSLAPLLNTMADNAILTSSDKEVLAMDKEQLLKEYELILQKKSDLSANKRDSVVWAVKCLKKQEEANDDKKGNDSNSCSP